MTAIRNVADTYKFQLGLTGDLGLRLAYTTLYWRRYLRARHWDPRVDPAQAHLAAWEYLGRTGWNSKMATVQTSFGLKLRVDLMTAFMILREVYAVKIYENCDLGDFSLHDGDIIFDIGSQQGTYTLLAALKAGSRGKVFAVEPEPRNHELLKGNIALNKFHNVRIFQAAISDTGGEAQLFINPDNTGGHSLIDSHGHWPRVSVQKLTLADLCREAGCAPTLIKIDVEGSVLAVLRGGLDVLRRHKPKIVLELDSPNDVDRIGDLLKPLGYQTRHQDNNLFAIAP